MKRKYIVFIGGNEAGGLSDQFKFVFDTAEEASTFFWAATDGLKQEESDPCQILMGVENVE